MAAIKYYNQVSEQWEYASDGADDKVLSVSGKIGDVILTKSDVGLSNVDNVSDINKPISNAMQSALNTKSATTHNHQLANLSEKSYNSLTDKPIIPDISDFETSTQLDVRDTNNRNRANHSGTQLASTISDLSSTIDGRINSAAGDTIAELVGGVIPTSQLPAVALTQVFSVSSQAAQLALVTEEGDMAIRTDESKTYVRNSGTTGTMSDWTVLATPMDAVTSVNGQTGVVVLGRGDVGLGNVDNTSDTSKPVSTAQQTALNLKANIASPTFTGTVSGVTKAHVGLSNVDNTSNATERAAAATLTNKNLSDSSNTVAFRRVVHGSTPTTARPNATHVEWVGSVAPLNANTTNDTWIDTA